jgi:hypothetical protein
MYGFDSMLEARLPFVPIVRQSDDAREQMMSNTVTRYRPSRRELGIGGLILAGAPAFAAASTEAKQNGGSPLSPISPRIEWLHAPTAIDTPRPRFSWLLHGPDDRRGLMQSAWRIVIASSAKLARQGDGDIWDSGRVAGSRPFARPGHDLPLRSQRRYYWSVQIIDSEGHASGWSAPSPFITGIMSPQGWDAKWIAAEPDHPVAIATSRGGKSDLDHGKPLPIFRREFALSRPIRRAIVSVCGLGQYELAVNGKLATASLLNPGWTDYRRTILYNSFDVTDLLRQGANALGVMLGNGMYNVEGVKGRYKKFVGTFGQPKLILQLRIEHEDGGETLVVSDEHWAMRDGPIRFSSIYGGEDYDARLDPDGWRLPGASAEGWSQALVVSAPSGRLKAQGVVPITVDRVYPAAKITEPKPGVFVYDLGKNAASRPRLTVRGPAGATVTLSPSEVLGDDGLIKPRSIGVRPGLPVYYAYTLAGTGDERWSPRFSYCGCRYLQVEGAAPADRAAPGTPAIVELANEFIHADAEQTGDFACSQTLLVQIHELIKQAVLSNTVSVFTDCPHREKLGWLEQDHLNAATLIYNEDAITLFEKTVSDIADAQLASGQIPEIAPEYVQFLGPDGIYRDSPEWGSTIVLGAWATYRFYGDDRVLAIGYPAMHRYADYLESKREADGIIAYGLGDWLDIGPHKNSGVSQLTTLGLTATATYYEMLTALIGIARVLGRPAAEANDYRRRAASVETAFNARFFHADQGSYDTGSQTANAMPLALGLVPAGREPDVLGKLVADIRSRQDHVTAGDVGFHYVVRALMEHGRPDVLHAMLSRTDPPSYGAQIVAGATALTENWDPADGGSQNHFMLGHAEQWLFEGLAGIGVDFSRSGPPIRIAPQPVLGVDSAGAQYRSAIGPISCHWQRQGQGLIVDVEIPPGATARVCLPGPAATIRESDHPAASAPGITAARDTPAGGELTIGSGRYRFATMRS